MIDLIKNKFPEAVSGLIEFRGETTIVVPPDRLIEVCTFLRDDPALKFDLLSDVSAVDHFPASPRFAVNYHLYSLENNSQLRLKVMMYGYWNAVTPDLPGRGTHPDHRRSPRGGPAPGRDQAAELAKALTQ